MTGAIDPTVITAGQPDRVLSEVASLELLDGIGVPTVGRIEAADADGAVAAADEIGFPVVLKGIVDGLAHKSERGLVAVGLTTPEEIREAAARMAGDGSEPIGFLVQEMCSGVELIVGISPSEFGPLLTVGFGGVAVEVLRDTVTALAPVDHAGARSMLDQLRGAPLLHWHRGRPRVDTDAVADVVVRLSQLVTDRPDVRELDVNPLMAGPDGAVAVDAAVVVGEPEEAVPGRRRPDAELLGRLFAPRGVAVVGAKPGSWNRGKAWMKQVRSAGYTGPISAVSRRAAVDDWPTFPSVAELPPPVDLVLAAVSDRAVPAVVADCVAAGIAWVAVYSTGFGSAELGGESAGALRALVAGCDTYVLGPGALGAYCPASGLVADGVPAAAGHIGIVSQSGGFVTTISKIAAENGLGVSKAVSYGQEADVPVDSLLDFLGDDPDTQLICLYIEGVSEPVALRESLARVCPRKPVLLLRGGSTEQGARAAVSHTGALAGSAAAWEALAGATGVSLVQNVDELDAALVAFSLVGTSVGTATGLVTLSGRAAVTFTDELTRHGLDVPAVPAATGEAIAALLPAGTSAANPVDMASGFFRPEVMSGVLSALAKDQAFEVVMLHFPMETVANLLEFAPKAIPSFLDAVKKGAAEAAAQDTPFVVIMPHTILDGERFRFERELLDEGIAVFNSVGSASRALAAVREHRVRFGSGPR
jgi:acyl-CoA synthetase (NDP forming)